VRHYTYTYVIYKLVIALECYFSELIFVVCCIIRVFEIIISYLIFYFFYISKHFR